jgi:hypothetical protein
MKTETAIANAKSAAALAKILKITPGAISQWGEDVPELRAYQLRTLRPEWFTDATSICTVAPPEQAS